MAAGDLLRLCANGCLLLGIPPTAALRLLVRRRPLRELFTAGTTRFELVVHVGTGVWLFESAQGMERLAAGGGKDRPAAGDEYF